MPTQLTLPSAATSSVDAGLLLEIAELYFQAKSEEIAPDTVQNYRNQLRPFLAYWEQCSDRHQHRISREVMRDCLHYVRHEYRNTNGQHPSPTSVRHCFVRLKQVFHWAFRQGCTGHVDLAEWCPIPQRVHPNLYFPTVEELGTLIRAPADEFRLRDVAMMAFMLSTGARVFETSNALVCNLHFQTPLADLSLDGDHRGHCQLTITKGDRNGYTGGRPVVFGKKAGLLLKLYLRSVRRGPEEPIFGLTHSSITKIIARHGDTVGLPEISPHAFRRAFADYWDEKLGSAYRLILKRQLGHSLRNAFDVTQTHYINNNPAINQNRVLREIYEHHVSPLNDIDIDWDTFPVHTMR